MRVKNWNPSAFDGEFEHVAIDRIVEGAEVVADAARANCPVGTISRPMYRSGPYAGQPWTARDAGQLKRSIRVTQKHEQFGTPFASSRGVRVYAGHYLAYYASIVEYSRPFMRPALNRSIPQLKTIIGVK